MSPQKDIKIIKQEQKQYTVDGNSPWILERAMTESQNVLIATNTAT